MPIISDHLTLTLLKPIFRDSLNVIHTSEKATYEFVVRRLSHLFTSFVEMADDQNLSKYGP